MGEKTWKSNYYFIQFFKMLQFHLIQIIANIALFLNFLSETFIEVTIELCLKALHIINFPC